MIVARPCNTLLCSLSVSAASLQRGLPQRWPSTRSDLRLSDLRLRDLRLERCQLSPQQRAAPSQGPAHSQATALQPLRSAQRHPAARRRHCCSNCTRPVRRRAPRCSWLPHCSPVPRTWMAACRQLRRCWLRCCLLQQRCRQASASGAAGARLPCKQPGCAPDLPELPLACRCRAPLWTALRVALCALPSLRQAWGVSCTEQGTSLARLLVQQRIAPCPMQAGATPLLLSRPARLGWLGGLSDLASAAAGTGLVMLAVGGSAIPLPPTALLAVQLPLLLLQCSSSSCCCRSATVSLSQQASGA